MWMSKQVSGHPELCTFVSLETIISTILCSCKRNMNCMEFDYKTFLMSILTKPSHVIINSPLTHVVTNDPICHMLYDKKVVDYVIRTYIIRLAEPRMARVPPMTVSDGPFSPWPLPFPFLHFLPALQPLPPPPSPSCFPFRHPAAALPSRQPAAPQPPSPTLPSRSRPGRHRRRQRGAAIKGGGYLDLRSNTLLNPKP